MVLCPSTRPDLGPAPSWRTLRTEVTPIAEKVMLHDLVHTLGGDVSDIHNTAQLAPVTLWRVRRDATLLHEGAPAPWMYVLRSGSMKRIQTLEDGYEQVLSFAQPGELLGFDALHSGRHTASVVALEDTTVCALPVAGYRTLRLACAALDNALQMALSRQLMRAAGTTEMMAAVASDVRLARFLLWMSMRMAEAGRSPRRLLLRMGRRDIASLLGVAHETVSRSFTLLAELDLVKVENREVEILDLDGLRRRARWTRRPSDEVSGSARPSAQESAASLSAAWFARAGTPAAALA